MSFCSKRAAHSLSYSAVITLAALLTVFVAFPSNANAQQNWRVQAGAESHNEARQADAFLPNEIWIYAGDSITFYFAPKHEIHTATLLQPSQVRPLFAGPPNAPVGCSQIASESAAQPSGSAYGGANAVAPSLACVNSGPLAGGAGYSVTFTTPGNYKLVCLVHADMTGIVHVLQNTNPAAPFYAASLLYTQYDYDRQARDQARELLADRDQSGQESNDFSPNANVVRMKGEMIATAGGHQYVAVVRFLPETIHVHAGDTVEWINTDPTEPHTITFGSEPPDPQMVVNAVSGADGALEAKISSPSDSVSSGFLQAAPQDRPFVPQSAPGVTRLRIQFTRPGTYHYICALHDVDGMVGKVEVLP